MKCVWEHDVINKGNNQLVKVQNHYIIINFCIKNLSLKKIIFSPIFDGKFYAGYSHMAVGGEGCKIFKKLQ